MLSRWMWGHIIKINVWWGLYRTSHIVMKWWQNKCTNACVGKPRQARSHYQIETNHLYMKKNTSKSSKAILCVCYSPKGLSIWITPTTNSKSVCHMNWTSVRLWGWELASYHQKAVWVDGRDPNREIQIAKVLFSHLSFFFFSFLSTGPNCSRKTSLYREEEEGEENHTTFSSALAFTDTLHHTRQHTPMRWLNYCSTLQKSRKGSEKNQ